jgi:hypothetical protein
MDRKNINRFLTQYTRCIRPVVIETEGHPFVWQCHDCPEGRVMPGIYINIHGETLKIDPKSLDPNTEVMRF